MDNNVNNLTAMSGEILPPNANDNSDDNSSDTNVSRKTEIHDKGDSAQPNRLTPPVSESRLRANRENAQKSTGPKTARGKRFSSRNAVKHGILSKKLLFSDDGKPVNEDLGQLLERLLAKYGEGDVRTQLLAEALMVEIWRQRQALNVELSYLKSSRSIDLHFSAIGNLPNVQRYQSSSQRAFLKILELLDELAEPASEGEKD